MTDIEKVTLYPNRKDMTTVEEEPPKRPELQSAAANHFAQIRSRLERLPQFRDVLPMIQSALVDLLLRGKVLPANPSWAVSLRGPNGTRLPAEVFIQSEPQVCTPEEFHRRTVLKLKRTLRNLKQLQKAYPEETELSQLISVLEQVDLEGEAQDLNGEVREVCESSAFQNYLGLKDRFFNDWKVAQTSQQAQVKPNAITEPALEEVQKALAQQLPKIEAKPDIMLYDRNEYFRGFNAIMHPQLNSRSADLWENAGQQETFAQFLEAVQERLGKLAPFHILRFESSFTYLLVGAADEELLGSLQSGEPPALHAKVVLRLAGQQYQELALQEISENYQLCLKQALHPFVKHLNEQLELQLDEEFITFFAPQSSDS